MAETTSSVRTPSLLKNKTIGLSKGRGFKISLVAHFCNGKVDGLIIFSG